MWYRRAAVACRSLVEGRWRQEIVWSLVLLFVQKLQLTEMISHELAHWVVLPTVAAAAIAAP